MSIALEAPSGANLSGTAGEPGAWSLPQRVGFRFLFLYVAFFCVPFPLYVDPLTRTIGGWVLDPVVIRLQWVIPAFARLVLGVDVSATMTGSGDRAIDWAGAAFGVVLAAVGAAIWSLVARRVSHHRTLLGALRILVRYYLAFTMLSYGWAKAFPSQFVVPGGERLVEPLGEYSPMGLLWTFMGFSPAYTIFAGVGELLGGTLLLFRRTATLGGLVVVAVMSNVAMMNLCYDVPVKLNSLHFLALSFFVVAPDARRLFDLFVANRPTAPRELVPRTKATRIVKALFVASIVWATVSDGYEGWQLRTAPLPLAGVYSVQGAPDISRIGIGFRGLRVVHPDGSTILYRAKYDDPAAIKVSIAGSAGPEETLAMTPDADGGGCTLTGTLDAKAVSLHLRRMDMPLTGRGFHWIQEQPFNR